MPMKMAWLLLCLPAAVAAAPGLSVDMNGEYRCDNGYMFTVEVLSAATIHSEHVLLGPGMSGTAPAGAPHTRMRHDVNGFDLYGAEVGFDGKHYRLMVQESDALMLRDRKGRLQWEIGSATAPYEGSLRRGAALAGEHCIKTAALAAPKD